MPTKHVGWVITAARIKEAAKHQETSLPTFRGDNTAQQSGKKCKTLFIKAAAAGFSVEGKISQQGRSQHGWIPDKTTERRERSLIISSRGVPKSFRELYEIRAALRITAEMKRWGGRASPVISALWKRS